MDRVHPELVEDRTVRGKSVYIRGWKKRVAIATSKIHSPAFDRDQYAARVAYAIYFQGQTI